MQIPLMWRWKHWWDTVAPVLLLCALLMVTVLDVDKQAGVSDDSVFTILRKATAFTEASPSMYSVRRIGVLFRSTDICYHRVHLDVDHLCCQAVIWNELELLLHALRLEEVSVLPCIAGKLVLPFESGTAG